jgi:hypothetical protein
LNAIETTDSLRRPAAYAARKSEFNELVYDYFGLRSEERVLVEELAAYAGPSLQPSSLNYEMLAKPIRRPPTEDNIASYCRRLVEILAGWRDATGGKGNLTSSVWTARSIPLGGVIVTISNSRSNKKIPNRLGDDRVVAELLDTARSITDGTLPKIAAFDSTHKRKSPHLTPFELAHLFAKIP